MRRTTASSATDTAGCVAAYTDLVLHAVPAPATNLKITFPEDVTSPSASSDWVVRDEIGRTRLWTAIRHVLPGTAASRR